MKSRRLESVDFLRCALMFLIVMGHCFTHGRLSGCRSLWTVCFAALIAWHVDAFIAISGWFGMRFAPSKVLKLLGIMMWYSALSVGYLYFMNRPHFAWRDVGVKGGWFGDTYLMFLFVAPFVNAAVERLKERPRQLYGLWFALAFVYFLSWIPGHLLLPFAPRGVNGNCLFLFFFVYVTTRLAKMLHEVKRVALKWWWLWGSVTFVFGIAGCGGITMLYRKFAGMPMAWRYLSSWSSYDAPHVWVFAIVVLIFFVERVQLPSWLARLSNFAAPSMFGIYLMHATTAFGSELYCGPQNWLMNHYALHPALIIVISAIVCFGVCLGVDLARRLVLRPVEGALNVFCVHIDEWWKDSCGSI